MIDTILWWVDWCKRRSECKIIDYVGGPGYYLPGQFLGSYRQNIGKTRIFETIGGKRAIFKLLNVETFSDPPDMIKKTEWQLIGYPGEKVFSEMSFKEYRKSRAENCSNEKVSKETT